MKVFLLFTLNNILFNITFSLKGIGQQAQPILATSLSFVIIVKNAYALLTTVYFVYSLQTICVHVFQKHLVYFIIAVYCLNDTSFSYDYL